ncbi:MAG: MFS transporter [Flavobacteriales bacterium]|jgi:putative MFS transporter
MNNRALWPTVLVASLGYFVDIFDLQLFNIVSQASLKGIGITDPAQLAEYDYTLFLWQMSGMLIGGLVWGILGDLKGRRKILMGSILIYSLANIANAFVTDIHMYALVRLIAGIGLAGELGAAITLVNEILKKESRGYGTMVIVTMGALGAVAAVYINKMNLAMFGLAQWQIMYIIGGLLGLLLLTLRAGTHESHLFDDVKQQQVSKGNFFMLFANRRRAVRYLACIAMGLPVWFCVGVLVKFSGKFTALGGATDGTFEIGQAIVYTYLGLSVGDLMSSYLSQVFKSRKRIVLAYLFTCIAVILLFLLGQGYSVSFYYFLCFAIGTATGYWALFVTIASETFGTNIRATVTTTVPNFVRGATVPIVLSFKSLSTSLGEVNAALIIGGICMTLSLLSLLVLPETFGKDLRFVEEG